MRQALRDYAPAMAGRQYYSLVEWSRLHGDTRGLGGLESDGYVSGLGDAQTVALSAPQIVGGSLTSGITSAAATGGEGATFLGMSSAAIPIIGVAVAGITLALIAIFSRKGPKQKVATTQIVNKVAPLWEQNLTAYMNGPHTASSQAQALANFDAGWQYIVDNCGIPEMGDPGQRCISERDRGGIYDGFAAWRDPIANDPNVRPDPVVDEVGNLIDSVTGGVFSTGGGNSGLLLLAGVALVVALMMGGGSK